MTSAASNLKASSTYVPPAARQTVARTVLAPSYVLVLAFILPFAGGLEVPERVLYAPFAFSLIFFGLPHGAVDHLVPGRMSGAGATARTVLAVVLLYLALSSAYLALWFVAPAAAFVLLISMTWFHWGQGDLYSLQAFSKAPHLGSRTLRVLAVVVRGGLPMLVPLLAFPAVYREVAASTAATFGGGAASLSWAFGPGFRTACGVAFAVLVLAYLLLALRYSAGNRKGWMADAAETLLLAAYFAVVPPVFAIGVYFCLWHATRHVARLMLLDKSSARALETGHLRPALAAFARDAAPLTLLAMLLLGGLYFVAPDAAADPGALLGLYLVLISILTLPHVVVVSFMDYRQGVWR